jgi:hypothetical protein
VSGRHDLYPAVIAEMIRTPGASANEIDKRLRAAGHGRCRNDILRAVKTLRSLPGVALSTRGPGRPQTGRVPFSRGREGARS